MKFKIQQISFYIILGLILLSSVAMFVERYVPHFEKLVLLLSFLASIFVLIYSFAKRKNFNKTYLYIILPILLSTFIYSFLIGKAENYLLQFIIIFSSLIPLLLIKEIEKGRLIFIAKALFILAFVQIFIDLAAPHPEYSDLDRYTGTFNSGNDKARFLLFILLAVYYLGHQIIKVRPFGSIFRFLYAMPIVVSIFLGFSIFAYLTLFLAIISGYFFKKLFPFLLVNVVGFIVVTTIIYNSDIDTESPGVITYNYHRYFDLEHGVAAVYNYGATILSDNKFIFGVGLGNWVSRSSQLLKSEYLQDNPSTMISYGTLYTETAAPPGMSAFYVQIVELGLISMPLVLLFLHVLFKQKSSSLFGFISFYFIFYFINYSPLFFEFQSLSYLFLSSYLIFNRLIRNYESSLLK